MAIDPLAEKDGNWSTYNYGFNNPARYNDPLGDTPYSPQEIVHSGYGSGGHHYVDWFKVHQGLVNENMNNRAKDPNHTGWARGSFYANNMATDYFSDFTFLSQDNYEFTSRYIGVERYTGKKPDLEADLPEGVVIARRKAKSYSYSLDFDDVERLFRKTAGTLLTVARYSEEAYKRASLYSNPRSGNTTLVIFGKKIFNKSFKLGSIEVNAVKAGKAASTLKIAGRLIGGAGIIVASIDIKKNGLTTSNSLDLAMSGLALTGFGTTVAGGYYLLNAGSMLLTQKDIGQHLDAGAVMLTGENVTENVRGLFK